MDLKDIDLNLMVIYHHLLTERSVSGAAEKLGLTQPTVSNALKRLRILLGDELFLRTSRGMEPTPYAIQLAEPIAYALSTLHNTLNQQTVFDPSTSKRKFILGMTDLGEIELLPTLPAAWATGSVRGLRARGGFEVDLAWAGGKLTRATLRAPNGGAAKLRYGSATTTLDVPPGKPATWNGR